MIFTPPPFHQSFSYWSLLTCYFTRLLGRRVYFYYFEERDKQVVETVDLHSAFVLLSVWRFCLHMVDFDLIKLK
ncbi:hypothetical protein L6452_40393 [Arctium lappa]|uniref:Uncharacterized protein n=1 Tax=Arctium lappa TaxID=4217 RepID=A0ACB8XMJ7_ARCLA|nr:hypothetical protein L6452_40393 [Arctium lappa]